LNFKVIEQGSDYVFRTIRIIRDKLLILDPNVGIVILNNKFERIGVITHPFVTRELFVSENGRLLALVSNSEMGTLYIGDESYFVWEEKKTRENYYIDIINFETKETILSLRSSLEPTFVEFSPDERRIIIGFGTPHIILFDLTTGESRKITFVDSILSGKWVDGSKLLLLHGNMEFLLYDLYTDKSENVFRYEGGDLAASFIDRKRKSLYYLPEGSNKIIRLNYGTGEKKTILKFRYVVNDFVYLPDMDIIIVLGDKYFLKVFDLNLNKWITGRELLFLDEIFFTASEYLTYISSSDGTFTYSTIDFKPISKFVVKKIKEITASNNELAALYSTGLIKIWDLSNWEIIDTLKLEESASISYIGEKLFIGNKNQVLIYEDGGLSNFITFDAEVMKLINAGALLLALLEDETLHGLKVSNKETIKLGSNVKAVFYDPWGKRLAIASSITREVNDEIERLMDVKVIKVEGQDVVVHYPVKMENMDRIFLVGKYILACDGSDVKVFEIGSKLSERKVKEHLDYLNTGVLIDKGRTFLASTLKKELMIIDSESLKCLKCIRLPFYIREILYRPKRDLIIVKTSTSDVVSIKKSELVAKIPKSEIS